MPAISLKIILFIAVLFYSIYASSQTIPAFLIIKTNGAVINTAKLIHTKPVVLIYFAPDCDHCIILLDKLFSQIDQFKKTEIILVSFKPLNEVAAFEKAYRTGKYKNIIVGSEQPAFFLKNFYKLESTPFTALYSRQGKLIYSYKKETLINDLIVRLRKIK